MSVQQWQPAERPELVGARWSSAVRCIAKAEYQALGEQGDPNAQLHLAGAFARGINAADNWVQQMARNYAMGPTPQHVETEVPIKWGPGGIWTGHADLVIPGEKLVLEAYHAGGGVFREEKALQVAFYARKLGPDYRAMLHALDTTKLVGEDEGFEVTPYAVDVDGLAARVDDIERRVIAAYENGAVDWYDRVGDGPDHTECKQCPFREICWADYEPLALDLVPEAEEWIDRLVHAQSNAFHARAAADAADEVVRELRALIRPYTIPGRAVRSGDITVKRILTAPRRGFKLTDYLKAGHEITPTMRDFATEGENEGERWYVKRLDS